MYSRIGQSHLLWPLALFLSGGALLLCVYWNIPLEVPLLVVAAGALLLYLAVLHPEWFLVAALFAPQWKDLPYFQSINRVADLTVMMLVFMAGGLIWRIARRFGGQGSPDFRLLFFGQMSQILAFAIFAAIVSASYFYTNAPEYGGAKLTRFLLIGGFFLFAPLFLILTEADFRSFARIFVGLAGVTAIQLVANLEMHGQDVSTDITKIGSGWLMGMAIILLAFYPLTQRLRVQRSLYLFLLPLLLAGLMASAARGPILAMCLALLLGTAAWLKQGRLKIANVAILLVIFIAGLGGSFLVLRQADLGKFNAKANEFKVLFSQGTSSGSAGDRLGFYQVTLDAIPRHLFLGTGIGSWGVFYYGSDTRGYPHDLILEILFEEGLIGLAAYMTLLLLVGISAVRMLKASKYHFIAPCLLVLFCVLVSLTSGDLDDNRVLWLWIGVTLAICRTVQLHFNANRVVRRNFRQPSIDRFPSPGVPAYPSPLARAGHSIPKRGRAWREKFV